MNHVNARRVVVMTGATGGLGAHALRHIASQPGTRVIIGARGIGRPVPPGVEILALDLAALASVRNFAAAVIERLAGGRIDVLVLNAGIFGSDARQRSADGFGLAFAVNHLAHYLLARLLLPHIADRGRLVITTSNMHDPPINAIGPKSLDLQEWAHPTAGGSGDGIRAYTASKLCNLMTALFLSRLPEVRERGIQVVAFNPGLTSGSSGRDGPAMGKLIVAIMMQTVYRLIGLFRPEFIANAPEHSGRMLADVSLGAITPPHGHTYVSLVRGRPTFPPPSALARDRDGQERLWRESATMVGLG